jgi:spermidine/putrescine transport system substrate-binding protein
MTGIAYNPEATGRPITKLEDLWDPAFAGKVGLFSDAQELANFGLLVLGIDPATSTPDDWEAAAAKLQEQKDAGMIRNYYDQGYADALANGEVWITQAWSGDILQLNLGSETQFEFVVPEEGGTIWTDNFAIPITAENPVDALECIDFFYRPEIAATLAEYIGYVPPVPSTQEIIEQHAAEADNEEDAAYYDALATSPLVFPSASDLAKLHYYVDFETTALQQQFLSTFEPIVLG